MERTLLTTLLQHSTTHQEAPGHEPRKLLRTLRTLALIAFPVILVVALQRISIDQPLKAGDAAPKLFFQSLNGKSVSLPDLYSHRLAVLFFGADCPHCKREMKNIERLCQMFRENIRFLLITTSDSVRTRYLLDSLGVTVTAVIDGKGKARSAFGVFTVPALFLIDSNGIVYASSFGEHSLDARREQLESFLQATADESRTLARSPGRG